MFSTRSPDLFFGQLADLQSISHIIKYIIMRQKCIALEYHRCITLVGCQAVDGLPAQIDLTLIRALKSAIMRRVVVFPQRKDQEASQMFPVRYPGWCHAPHRSFFQSWDPDIFWKCVPAEHLFLFLHDYNPPLVIQQIYWVVLLTPKCLIIQFMISTAP